MNNTDIKQIIEDTFDDVSSLYDINEYFLITAKKMVNNLEYKGYLNILDLSCGTGNVALLLASKFKNSKVIGVDISSSMIEVASQKAKDLRLSNVQFIKADVENLDYEDKTFDIITCGFGLFFYSNMNESLKSFMKLLKNDGVFTFSSFTKEAFNPYSDIFLDSLHKDYGLNYPKGSNLFLETEDEINDLVKAAGKYRHKIEKLEISKLITVEQWWDTLNSAGYKGMLNQLSKDDLEKFKTEHFKDVSKFCKDGKINLQTDTFVTKVFI
ncbi:class I SAM-dependent methyltransferase [Poseidonibacter lekithochrous]|uniref:class I SAM-dependent methyltransferase n=1 Tax=Poseidonibacter lekithochrous TaxID=1904463 RepID=UPI000D34FC56|nr:methyltransferase domain-containing protein [Poseidonibacter lekithochrous]